MSLFARAADFLTDRVASRLAAGSGPRNQPSRAELEAEAGAEIQARIDQGRPGAEEAARRGPPPAWAVPPAKPSVPIGLVTVRLDALGGPPAAPERPSVPVPARPPAPTA
ncbi:MAG: hypothetical protein AB1673_15705 [Actinomycetota bacterium]